MKIPAIVLSSILVVVGLYVIFSSFYTVDEGKVYIVKRWGEAVKQVDPGLHFKFPISDTTQSMDIRARKNAEVLSAATEDQLPIDATVSIIWVLNKESALDMYKGYNTLEHFEQKILDPILRSATKAALAKYPAVELIRNRQLAVGKVMDFMTEALAHYPITITSPQIENIKFPPRYEEAIKLKEVALEDSKREKHKLEKQRLEALQKVNTANANAESKKIEADAEAYRVRETANAEADAIEVVNKQLAVSPRYIDLVKAKAWNGRLPTTMLGNDGGTGILLSLDPKSSSSK